MLTLEPFAPEDVMPKFVVVVPDSAEDELVVVYEPQVVAVLGEPPASELGT